MSQLTICILIFVVSLILYGLNKFPMGVVGLMTMLAISITGCLPAKDVLGYFGDKNLVMTVSMFVVSAGLSRTSLIDKFSKFICKITGNSFKRTIFVYMVLAMILTNLMTSPGAVFCIVFPLAAEACKEYGVSPSKVMFPLGVVCVGCCCILPFGAAISQGGINQGLYETYNLGINFNPIDFTIGRWPFLLIIPLWAITLGLKMSPEKPTVPIGVEITGTKEKKPLNRFSDIAGVMIFGLVVLLIFFGNKLGIAAWQAALAGAVLDIVCGTLTKNEAIQAIPVDLACMLAGALSMAGALTQTGAGQVIGDVLANVVGNVQNQYILGAIFFLIPFLLTQFMQNQAIINIFTPIVIMTCQAIGGNPTGLIVLITAAGLTAYMTPMATSAVPIMMGAGGYDIKSLVKQSALPSVLFAAIYIGFTMTVLPVF
ncbi:Di-and tricarboxylate transporter [Oribacterium sp. KHPX15]|uniref:SLC13 family permease n=1 Tax=Oribacterium sp. KHPX15 TaxID=1855342 RepID=UPI0008988B0B|nr:SLC13 family permease [Oribacterium sp. KHPX15]SEA84028.1 Di-and tricarboxylate transporter [Oribacterium sp. KHPX15]